MSVGLTRKQRDTLLIIQELSELDGFSPTYDEISRELGGCGRGEVHRLVSCLIDRGYLARTRRGGARALVVVQPVPMPAEFAYEVVACREEG